MTWSDLPVSAGTVWSNVSFINQFIRAINERMYVTQDSSSPVGLLDELAVGDLIQEASFWAGLQQACEDLASAANGPRGVWIDPSAVTSPENYDGQFEFDYLIDFNFTPNQHEFLGPWRTAAGNPSQGWTRRFPNDSGGFDTEYGQMETGDIIGPWIFDELYNGLRVLVWSEMDSLAGFSSSANFIHRTSRHVSSISAQDARDQAYSQFYEFEGSAYGPTIFQWPVNAEALFFTGSQWGLRVARLEGDLHGSQPAPERGLRTSAVDGAA